MNRTNFVTHFAVTACLVAAMTEVGPPASAAHQRTVSAVPARHQASFHDTRYDNSPKLAVSGTLETAVIDTFGSPGHDVRRYGIRLAAGGLIPVPASFGSRVRSGGQVTGHLAITGDLAQHLRERGVPVGHGRLLRTGTTDGQIAADVASGLTSVVPVADATVVAPAAVITAVPRSHHAYVAVIKNRGSVDLSSSQIASYVSSVTGYWVAQSNGAITSFNTARTVTYSSSAASSVSSGCGLLNPYSVWNEAAKKFPGVSFFGTGNHLMVLVANECASAGPVGIGTIGASIGYGGETMVALTGGRRQAGAHELGHNMSLDHANFEYCPSSCSISQYKNVHSVMALAVSNYSPPVLDTAYRALLGITGTGEVADLALPAGTGAATFSEHLSPRSASSGLRGLRVTDPGTGSVYYVEYRSGQGADARTFYASTLATLTSLLLSGSARAHYAPGIVVTQKYSDAKTRLLSRKSGSSYYSYYSAGRTYSDSTAGIKVVVKSTGGSLGSDVDVVLSRWLASSKPTIVGTVAVGRTVRADPGIWAAGAVLSYSWRRDGVVIPGATGDHYVIGATDLGRKLSVRVSGSEAGYATIAHVSPSRVVAPGTLSSSTPTIAGTPTVGSVLTALPGAWTPGTVFTYQWYANGNPILLATAQTYRVHSSKLGKRLSVRVRGAQPGYTALARMSASTATVT